MNYSFYIALSPIHDKGLFASEYFPVGTLLLKICDLKGNVTELGAFINHSRTPNITVHREEDGYYAVSTMPIYQGREIVGNYDFTPSVLEKADPSW